MPAGDQRARLRMIVSGRVQGVFFRGAAAAQARALGVTGYARNLDDGTVEIVAEGGRDALELMAAWAHHGPSPARVEEVRTEWSEVYAEFSEFSVK
jgi:acylphosphatase